MLARRALLLALASPLALPLGTWAQPGGKVYRIGFLSAQSAALFQPQLKAFREKLSDLGYAEGRNLVFEARSRTEIDQAFSVAVREREDALLVLADPMMTSPRKRIVDLAVRGRLPLVAYFRAVTEAGGLLSYGPNTTEIFRQLAFYADKIFKGAKPADLPIEEPTKYELVINLKT